MAGRTNLRQLQLQIFAENAYPVQSGGTQTYPSYFRVGSGPAVVTQSSRQANSCYMLSLCLRQEITHAVVNLRYTNIYANYFKCLGGNKLLSFGLLEPDEQPVVLSGQIAGADANKKNKPKALLSHAAQWRQMFPLPLIGCNGNYTDMWLLLFHIQRFHLQEQTDFLGRVEGQDVQHQNIILTETHKMPVTRGKDQFWVMGNPQNWYRKAGYIKGTYSLLQRIKLLVL